VKSTARREAATSVKSTPAAVTASSALGHGAGR
jgi:hypothetical protein